MKDLNIHHTTNFLTGQLELYKIEFVATNDRKYLEVMHELSNSIDVVNYLKKRVIEISKEKRELKEELNKLKQL